MHRHNLLTFLRWVQAENGGLIPFERFMQESLYHPNFGYYTSQIRGIGAKGDFSTSATLDEKLGVSIAAWIRTRAKTLGWSRIPVIEIGAGDGSLALTILRKLGWKTRWRTDYMIHETSAVLRQQQQKLLKGKPVQWTNSMLEALRFTKGRALIFSNELIDAFPCRLFQKGALGWGEVGVMISEDGSLSEVISPPVTQDQWFNQFEKFPQGQRVERHDTYRNWLRSWGNSWKEGFLLNIDYGDTIEHLYHQRPMGSLRAYRRHQRITGLQLYAHFGKQDLTSDVNFSDLIFWGEEQGWKTCSLIKLGEFLATWLPMYKPVPSSTHFFAPDGACDAFKVLEQYPISGRGTGD